MKESTKDPLARMIRQQLGLLAGNEWLFINKMNYKVEVFLDRSSKQPRAAEDKVSALATMPIADETPQTTALPVSTELIYA